MPPAVQARRATGLMVCGSTLPLCLVCPLQRIRYLARSSYHEQCACCSTGGRSAKTPSRQNRTAPPQGGYQFEVGMTHQSAFSTASPAAAHPDQRWQDRGLNPSYASHGDTVITAIQSNRRPQSILHTIISLKPASDYSTRPRNRADSKKGKALRGDQQNAIVR